MSETPSDRYEPPSADVLKEAVSAVLYGAVGTSPMTYDGVRRVEALDYAATLAEFVKHLLEEDHTVDLRQNGWTIQHPLSCRLNGKLFDCPVNEAAQKTLWRAPDRLGRFVCWRNIDGTLSIGGAA